jgi:redox-sensitive bicupin YhaK (pirin superfamily)
MKNHIDLLIPARASDIGIPVRRLLPWAKKRTIGPFIFLDHMGPVTLAAGAGMDVRPHPHIGLSTLTYLFAGEIMHRDSLGVEQLILPGEVNWMTAGRGIAHSEREPQQNRSGPRTVHGLQFWVALPVEEEDREPSFRHYEREQIPEVGTAALAVKVVAGEAFGVRSELETFSPMTFLVMEAKDTGRFQYQREGHEYGLYVVDGELTTDDQRIGPGELAVFAPGSEIELTHSADARFVLIGGEALPEKRHIFWNFVSSDPEKIERAKRDWAAGTFPAVSGDHERIPLPPDPAPKVNYP